MLKLSIISINLNNAPGLRKTIESVVSQTFTDYEYIIIDGGSTDGSVDVIKEYADRITYWVSELDKGIYNAMNKGILSANGEYCLFLNSGDYLNQVDALEKIFSSSNNEDLIYWDIVSESGKMTQQEVLTVYKFIYSTIGHPASLIKRKLFDLVGLYNESNRIASDWEFFLKLFLQIKFTYKYLNKSFTYCEAGGVSARKENKNLKYSERLLVLNREINPLILKDYESWREEKMRLKRYEKSIMLKMTINLQRSRIYISVMNFFRYLRLSRR